MRRPPAICSRLPISEDLPASLRPRIREMGGMCAEESVRECQSRDYRESVINVLLYENVTCPDSRIVSICTYAYAYMKHLLYIVVS